MADMPTKAQSAPNTTRAAATPATARPWSFSQNQNRTKPDETPPSPRNGPLIINHLQPKTRSRRPVLPSRNACCNHAASGILDEHLKSTALPIRHFNAKTRSHKRRREQSKPVKSFSASLRLRAFALTSLSTARLSSSGIVLSFSLQIRVHPCLSVVASLFSCGSALLGLFLVTQRPLNDRLTTVCGNLTTTQGNRPVTQGNSR